LAVRREYILHAFFRAIPARSRHLPPEIFADLRKLTAPQIRLPFWLRPFAQKTLSARLSAKGHESRKANGTRAYWGIRLKGSAGEKKNAEGVIATDADEAGDDGDLKAAAPEAGRELKAKKSKQSRRSRHPSWVWWIQVLYRLKPEKGR
jgi:hypothetical protein